MHDIQEICFLQVHIYTRRELERGKSWKGVKTRISQMHFGESATLLRQRENESDKRTRDIISIKIGGGLTQLFQSWNYSTSGFSCGYT